VKFSALASLPLFALAISACGGDQAAPQPIVAAPSPTPSPSPSPSPSPTPTPTPSAARQIFTSDIQYGEGETASGPLPLRLDLYEPDEPCSSNRPAAFFVHGGGFTSGNKRDENIRMMAETATNRGLNFISINYRLDPDEPLPSVQYRAIVDEILIEIGGDPNEPRLDAIAAAFEDAVTALNFISDNQDALCTDASRLGFWGSSAGATTVMQVAYGLNQYGIQRPEPLVVIDYWGNLLRDRDVEVGEAPFLVVHGTRDATSPYQNALDLTAQADVVGINYALYSVINAGHGFRATGVFTNTVNGQTLVEVTADFIEAHLTGGTPVYQQVDITP